MLTNLVPTGNTVAGRVIAGVLTLSMDHPFVLAAILAMLAGASGAVLLDTVTRRP